MRKRLLSDIERNCRIRSGPMRSDPEDGMNGAFMIPLVNKTTGTTTWLKVVASDGSAWHEVNLPGEPWEHVSVSCDHRTPTWAEMDYIRSLFWDDDETVLQFHVPRSKHINFHQFCLHMWKPKVSTIPLPPEQCVGPAKTATETK